MPDIKHLLSINAPTEAVYNAVTTQEGVAGWWTTENTTSNEVGGDAEFAADLLQREREEFFVVGGKQVASLGRLRPPLPPLS